MMIDRKTQHDALLDIADYFRGCLKNADPDSAAARRFQIYIEAVEQAEGRINGAMPRNRNESRVLRLYQNYIDKANNNLEVLIGLGVKTPQLWALAQTMSVLDAEEEKG